MTFKKIDYDKPFDIANLTEVREVAAEASEKHRTETEKLKRDAKRRRQKQSATKPNPFKTGEKPVAKPTSGIVLGYDPTTDKYRLLTDEGEVQGECLTNGNVKIGSRVPIYRVKDRILFKVPPVNRKKGTSQNRNQDNPYVGKGTPNRRPVKNRKTKIRIGVTAVFLRWDGDGANLPPRPPDPPPDGGGGGGGGGTGSGGSSG